MNERKPVARSFADKRIIIDGCTFDNKVSIGFDDRDNIMGVTIETAFQFFQNDVETTIDPEKNSNIEKVISLMGCRLLKISASNQGVLSAEFDNGIRFVVPLHPKYEAWSVTFTDGPDFWIGSPE